MVVFLLYVFVKGPRWLRVLAWLGIGMVLLFASLIAFTRPSDFQERPAPNHVHHSRPHTDPFRP